MSKTEVTELKIFCICYPCLKLRKREHLNQPSFLGEEDCTFLTVLHLEPHPYWTSPTGPLEFAVFALKGDSHTIRLSCGLSCLLSCHGCKGTEPGFCFPAGKTGCNKQHPAVLVLFSSGQQDLGFTGDGLVGLFRRKEGRKVGDLEEARGPWEPRVRN